MYEFTERDQDLIAWQNKVYGDKYYTSFKDLNFLKPTS